MGPDNCPIGLRRFQFGSEALRPDGLLGVVLPSLVLLSKKLADEFLGVFGDTGKGRTLRIGGIRGRRSVIPAR